jgi:hypothetical protein
MSLVLRGEKTLPVGTAFGGSLTAVDIGTDLVYFLPVSEVLVSLERRLLRLFTESPLASKSHVSFKVL